MATTQEGNIAFLQTRMTDRLGDGLQAQSTDGVFTSGNLLKSKVDGTATDSGILAANVALKSAIQQEAYTYAADTGTANAYAVTLSPAPTIVAGSEVVFKAANANTGASTLALNGATAVAITKNGNSTALASGDISAGQIITAKFDGTVYQISVPGSGGGAVSSLTTTGSSGAATLTGSVLNIPIYSGGGGGSSFSPYGALAASPPPSVSTLTWVNQGAATAADVNSGIALVAPASATDNWRMLVKSAPAAPYTFTVMWVPTRPSSGSTVGGLVIRDSSTGKFLSFWLDYSSGFFFALQKWNSPTSFSANAGITSSTYLTLQPWFLRVTDNGTNHIFYWSDDGATWTQMFSLARTSWLANPNQIGIGADPANSTAYIAYVPYWS
jgi:hypothetical protein